MSDGNWIKRFFTRFITGSDRSYAELGPIGKFTRVLWISGVRYGADHNSLRAVALTFYTLFAVVPMLALAFGIAKGFNLQERLQDSLTEKLSNHRELLEWIYQFADTTLREAQGGVIAGVGVAVLVVTVMWLVNNIEKSFNSIWNLPSRGNLFRRFNTYLSLILVTPFLIIILSSAGPVLRRLLSHGGTIGEAGMEVFSVTTEVFPLLLVCVTFTLIYIIAPNTRVRFLSALLAGVVAGIMFQMLQDGFIILQTRIYRYNKIYGSFAILPLFLIWLKLSWQITLFGAEISFIHQHAGSGLFDRLGKTKLSLKLRREYQLLILGRVYRSFDKGLGAIREERLFAELPLPQVLVISLLEELVDAQVLYRIEADNGERSYLPARPVERCTICEALERLEAAGLQHPPAGGAAVLERVNRNVEGIRRTAAGSSCNLPLKELDPS